MTPLGLEHPPGPALIPASRTIKNKLHVTIFFFFSVEEGKGKQETSSELLSFMWLPEAFTLHHLPCINQLPEYQCPASLFTLEDYVPLADLSCN